MIAESFSFMSSPPLVLARVEQRPQLLGDRLARAEYPRPDRPDRAVHDRGDILVAQAFELAQRDGIAQLPRAAASSVSLTVCAISADISMLSGVLMSRNCSPSSKPSASSESNSGRGRRAPAHRHQVVLRGVDADPVQPRIERAVAPERGERPIRLDECFLCDILDFDRIPDEPGQQPRQLCVGTSTPAARKHACRLAGPARPAAGRDSAHPSAAVPDEAVLALLFVSCPQAAASIPQCIRRPRRPCS